MEAVQNHHHRRSRHRSSMFKYIGVYVRGEGEKYFVGNNENMQTILLYALVTSSSVQRSEWLPRRWMPIAMDGSAEERISVPQTHTHTPSTLMHK